MLEGLPFGVIASGLAHFDQRGATMGKQKAADATDKQNTDVACCSKVVRQRRPYRCGLVAAVQN